MLSKANKWCPDDPNYTSFIGVIARGKNLKRQGGGWVVSTIMSLAFKSIKPGEGRIYSCDPNNINHQNVELIPKWGGLSIKGGCMHGPPHCPLLSKSPSTLSPIMKIWDPQLPPSSFIFDGSCSRLNIFFQSSHTSKSFDKDAASIIKPPSI